MKNQSAVSTVNAQTDRFLAGCGVFVFAVALIWTLFFVPMNMDEAGIYHVLACVNYPFSSYQIFRDSCVQQQVLTLPIFDIDMIRPERYTGILHSVMYAPFYFLFHSPAAQYAFNVCFFGGCAYFLSRETRKPLLSMALFLSFFPFVFQFVHDTGPVNFAILVFPLSAMLFRKIFQAPSSVAYGWAAALALLFLAAVEDKPFFLYLLPALGFFVLAQAGDPKETGSVVAMLKRALGPLLAASLIAAVGLCFLLFSVNHDGMSYITWLMDITDREQRTVSWIELFADFMLYWPSYAHYFYALSDDDMGPALFDLLTAALMLFCLFAAVHEKALFSGYGRRFLFLILSFVSTVVVFAVVGNTWAGHHFVFLWVPLMVIFADLVATLPAGLRLIAVAGFFALNLGSVVTLTQATLLPADAGEREAVFHYFNDDARASQAIINFSSWGGYYIQALYGPKNQLVTYTEPHAPENRRTLSLTNKDAMELLNISQKTGRRIYNVCTSDLCNKAGLEAAYNNRITFEEVMPGLPNWHIFAATPRKGG